jgi:hypothetical protein
MLNAALCPRFPMTMRLLSFLSTIEKTLQADDPSPKDGVWENHRTINFQLGLARLSLGSRRDHAGVQPVGAIMVQSFALADGSLCLKASLSWEGQVTEETVHSVYAEPQVDWIAAARRIAAAWMAGPPVAAKAESEEAEELAVAS